MGRSLRYKRGQVWRWIDREAERQGTKSFENSIQHGSRPALIVSSDAGNLTSDCVQIIPLSTQTQKKISINVNVVSADGTHQLALCNQLKLVSKSELSQYLYDIDSATMQEVEKGILTSLGMQQYIHNVIASESFDKLKSVIESIVSARVESILHTLTTPKITVDDILSMTDQMIKDSQNFKDNRTSQKSNSSVRIKTCQPSKRVRKYSWTEENCIKFLQDVRIKSNREVGAEWNMNPDDVSKYKNYCAKKLDKLKSAQ